MLTLAIGDLFIPERSIDIPQKFKNLLAPSSNIPYNNKIQNVVCLGNLVNSQSSLSWLSNISPSFNYVKGEHDDDGIISQQLQVSQIPMYGKFQSDNLKIGYTNGYHIVPKSDPLALSSFARELDVDILIWGGTHKVEAYTLDGKFFINPGSATGAFSFDWPDEDEEEDDEEEEEETKKEEQGQGEEIELKKESISESVSESVSESKSESNSKQNTEEDESKEKVKQETKQDSKTELFKILESHTNIPSFCLLDTQGSTCTLYIYTYLQDEVKVDKITYTKS